MIERIYTSLHLHELGLAAGLDILLLAFIIYQLLLLIRGTRSVNMMIALAVLIVLHVLTGIGPIRLQAVHTVLGTLLLYVPLAIIVLFQNHIRRFLSHLGRNPLASLRQRREEHQLVDEIALAAASLASKRLGALIVIERDMGLRSFYETGIALDAIVSYDLLLNIFTFRSPLHDGAVIIADGRIRAASCYLPLTTNPSLSRTYGTRHRAAFGITEESDAIAVVVSEERGIVSLVDRGRIVEGLDAQTLGQALRQALTGGDEPSPRRRTARTLIAPRASDA